MHCYICETCGTQHAPTPVPPSLCRICTDERQYVGLQGQRWTTLQALANRYRLRVSEDAGLLAIGVDGDFGIPQRALLLPTSAGNILWECVSLVTEEGVAALQAAGGVNRIVISHPHFYTSMVAWSDALGGVPIVLHRADQAWVQRSSAYVQYWEGEQLELSADVHLLRVGGHFPGSTALHWRNGPRVGGALFPGDALQVAMDRRQVGFLYSYPNNVPMQASAVRRMRALLAEYRFSDIYGYTWGRNIIGNGRAAVDASFERFLTAARS